MSGRPLFALGLSGSGSATSRSRLLVDRTLAHLRARGAHTTLIDLAALPASALLGRERSPSVDEAVAAAAAARILVIGTPVYRASYTGLLKCFKDRPKSFALTIGTGGSSSVRSAPSARPSCRRSRSNLQYAPPLLREHGRRNARSRSTRVD